MKYSLNKKFITGTAIPVTALRSKSSCGVGEFSDLKGFADWCKVTGIDLIQLLPVNDTGYMNSPYSAISAFALHPIYMNIMEIPEAKPFKSDFEKLKKKWDIKERVYFYDLLKAKLKLLQKIYKENIESIEKSRKIKTWEKNNPWIKTYAVFSYLKDKNKNAVWEEWQKFRDPSCEEIETLYEKHRDKTRFYSWVQFHLEGQLKAASEYIDSLGINLKGDLPILMNVDSADVWENRDIFNVNCRAGAPPDMYAEDGQNWGFPTYDWKAMEKNDFQWWKNRLHQAAKYYHAYRIDHVLGFFRIWSIPPEYTSGSMGYYSPADYITADDLNKIGINGDRLRWMTKPHVPGYELRDNLGLEAGEVIDLMLEQIDSEDLYLFKPEIDSVHVIRSFDTLSSEAQEKMVNFYQNIAILKISEDKFASTWNYYNSRAYYSMNDHEKWQLNELLRIKGDLSMKLWERQGLKLLKFMKESEDMLVCAEDLGTIPDCVPNVLGKLGILGLHVTRWSRKYQEQGQPYIKPAEYDYLKVSTPAVHDSSTVREWWSEVASNSDIPDALNIQFSGSEATPENVTLMYKALLKTTAQVAMFQFQDLLAIDNDLRREDEHSERINVPGTVTDVNWSYRMDFTVEDLILKKDFNDRLKNLIAERG